MFQMAIAIAIIVSLCLFEETQRLLNIFVEFKHFRSIFELVFVLQIERGHNCFKIVPCSAIIFSLCLFEETQRLLTIFVEFKHFCSIFDLVFVLQIEGGHPAKRRHVLNDHYAVRAVQ